MEASEQMKGESHLFVVLLVSLWRDTLAVLTSPLGQRGGGLGATVPMLSPTLFKSHIHIRQSPFLWPFPLVSPPERS